jgi:membrane associated rhomboid family serine protease
MDRLKWIFMILFLYMFFFEFFTPSELRWDENLGEPYRMFTFMFSHNSKGHLILNISSLILVALICYELGISTFLMSYTYIIGSLSVLPLTMVFGESVIGGSSGIYAILGLISQNLYEFKIPRPFGFLIFLPTLFLEPCIGCILPSTRYHTASFLVGALLSGKIGPEPPLK